jgi:AraC-like DNA-binding protein
MINYPIRIDSSLQIDNIIDISIRKNNNERQCRSTPGHLLHWVYSGNYELLISGKHYHVNEGDFIYYYNSEDVYWLTNPCEVKFYSLAFQSPNLSPINYSRVFKPCKKTLMYFQNLIDIQHTGFSPFKNECAIVELLQLITTIFDNQEKVYSYSAWEQCENELLKNNIYRSSLKQMSKLAGVSQATLGRSCHQKTGISPLKKLQELRMEKALNLIRHSAMRIGEIALFLGYQRVHEFSREFKNIHSHSPKYERLNLFQTNKN